MLNRSARRPHVTSGDRIIFVVLASTLQQWKEALLIVKPETILRWHRLDFRLFLKTKSQETSCAPKIPLETITLIKDMAGKNRLWGAERIRAELLKVGIKSRSALLCGTCVRRVHQGHMDRTGRRSSATTPTTSGPATSFRSRICASGRSSHSSSWSLGRAGSSMSA